MRTTTIGIAVIAGAVLLKSETVLSDPIGKVASGSAQSDVQMLKRNLGPKTEVTVTYSPTQPLATVQIGKKRFFGYRNEGVVYFSELVNGKTHVDYELELSPDFDPERDKFVYQIPGTAIRVPCGSPGSLILTIFREGKREDSTCIE